jgi:hypothetical protein
LEGSGGALIEILSMQLPGGQRKPTKTSVRIAVSQPIFEMSTYQIQYISKSVTGILSCSVQIREMGNVMWFAS